MAVKGCCKRKRLKVLGKVHFVFLQKRIDLISFILKISYNEQPDSKKIPNTNNEMFEGA